MYRVARTALMISNRKDDVRTLVMTSPQPGDGKSTTVSNLAISFARTGKKVLIIDADMRRPVISTLFGIECEPGLSDALKGSIAARETPQSTEVDNLDVVPSGSATESPAELLESPRFAMLLTEMSQRYDLVLVDAPPLLAVADPAIIAPLVDSVMLTVRIQKNGRGPVQHATKILRELGITPSAVVVNGIDQDATTYGYGTYSRDEYGYVGQYHSRYSAPESSSKTRPKKPASLSRKTIDTAQSDVGPHIGARA